jgi:alkyl hydroperoxide reductase subunit F
MNDRATTDPVCGMEVHDRRWTADYLGREYAFCSEGCLGLYREDPAARLSGEGERRHYDLVIIGGGPAGLTAAVYASLQHFHALLLTKELGGQAADTSRIKNYMGYDLITGPELLGKFRDQLLAQKYIEHRLDEVLRVERSQDGFTLQTRNGCSYQAPVLIVATGMHRRRLDVPGEQRLQRRGVSYRLVHELERYQGLPVAVVGGGNSGIEAANELARIGCTVTLVSSGPLTGDAADIAQLSSAANVAVLTDHEVVAIEGEDRVSGVRVQPRGGGDEECLGVAAVFIEIGFLPNADCVAHLVRRNRKGEIKIANDCSTSLPGMFAAGDVTDGFGQRIIIAAGEGARAALSAGTYLRARAGQAMEAEWAT